ncbi:manganese transport protein [Burkholderia sp. OAS925]
MQFKLPTTATAPFCPSEVQGSVAVSQGAPFWKKILQFAGPGLLVSIGYMDPGNWATDIEAGSRYGYSLLFVVMLSSLAAMALQCLSMRLGIVTGRDLAELSRARYSPAVARFQWLLAELSIIACDLAEVLGGALAFHLLFKCSLTTGVLLTAFDTLIVLGLKGKNFRDLEAIMLGLIATIGVGYIVELALVKPHWPSVAQGLIPSWQALSSREPMYLAIGILGATVMPHNLYLHSSIVQTRAVKRDPASIGSAIGMSRIDTIASLLLALMINMAILILAAAAFHATGHNQVTEIEDAYKLLAPIVGTGFAAVLFAVTLLASGQSSTFTGHGRGTGHHGRLSEAEDSLLAASLHHTRARADSRADRRADDGQRRGGQTARRKPGRVEPAIAVRALSADPHDGRPFADGRVREYAADENRRVVAVCGDYCGESLACRADGGTGGVREQRSTKQKSPRRIYSARTFS